MWRGNNWQTRFSTPSIQDDKIIVIENEAVDNEDDSTNIKYKRLATETHVEFSTEQVLKILKTLFGSVQNVLQYCGEGTYLLAGPTNAGKTFSIESMVHLSQLYAQSYELKPVRFTSLIIFSSTDEITDDFKWAQGHVRKIAQSDKKILEFLEIRKKELIKGATRWNITPKEYAKRYPMLICIDDFVGMLNGTGANSPLATLASKARHLGLYVFLLTQSIKQVGPGVRKNARAIIGFRLELSAIQDILKEFYGIVNNYTQAQALLEHMSVTYTPTIFVLNWLLNSPEYNNITRRILSTPPFPSGFDHEVEWSDPNQFEEEEKEEPEFYFNKDYITDNDLTPRDLGESDEETIPKWKKKTKQVE
jgi:hypothetical protein